MQALINWLDLYLGQKAPSLPTGLKEFIVKIAPYGSILIILFSVPALLAIFGASASLSFGMGRLVGSYLGPMYYASLVVLGITVVLEIMALPGLFNRTPSGWNFKFYATLVSIVSLFFSYYSFSLSSILWIVISLYVLFQIKPYYFGGAVIQPASSVPPVTPPQQPPTPPQTPPTAV